MNTEDPAAAAFQEHKAHQELKRLWSLGFQLALINLAAY